MQLAQLEFSLGDAAQTIGIPGAENATAADGVFGAFLGQILSAVFAIATLLVFLYLIWGAISWISSGGDKGKVEQARNRITQAVIGLIVLASTLVLMVILQGFLGYELFTFSGGSDGTSRVIDSSGLRRSGIPTKSEEGAGTGTRTLPGTSGTKTGPTGTKF